MSAPELYSIQGINKVELLQALYKHTRIRQAPSIDAPETLDERSAKEFLAKYKKIEKIFTMNFYINLSQDLVNPQEYNEYNGTENDPTPFQTIAGKLKPVQQVPTLSTTRSIDSRRETKEPEQKNKQEEKDIKETQETPFVDMFQRKALNQFLKQSALSKEILEINTTPHNEQIHILCKTKGGQQNLIKILKNLIESKLKYTPSKSELGEAHYPSDFYECLVQAHIPFEENSVVFDDQGNISQIKFPYGSLKEAQKLALYLLYNIKNPTLALFESNAAEFPTLNEKIALLPDVSDVQDLDRIIESYSDILRIFYSRIGEYDTSRVVVTNYNKLLELLVLNLGKPPTFSPQKIRELRFGVYVNGSILGKALTLETGAILNIDIKQALKLGNNAALQLQIDHSHIDRHPIHIAALVNTTNRSHLEKLFETLSIHLSKYSEIYFSLITCNAVVQNPIKRVLVTRKALTEIKQTLLSTKFEGSANILSALELLKTVFQSKNEYPIILTATELFSDVTPNFPDQIKRIFTSYPSLPVVKAVLFKKNYDDGGVYGSNNEFIYTQIFAAMGNRGSQFINLQFTSNSEIELKKKFEQLILSPLNPLSNPIQVEFHVQGVKNPFRGVIPPNRLNEPNLRTLFIPNEIIVSASAKDGNIKIVFKYENRFIGSKIIPVKILEQANLPLPTEEISFYNDWIEQMFFFYGNVTPLQFESLSFLKQFEIINKILLTAKELNFKEAEYNLQERLQFIMRGLAIEYLYNEQFTPIVKNRIKKIIEELEKLPIANDIQGDYFAALIKILKDRQTLTIEKQWLNLWQELAHGGKNAKHSDAHNKFKEVFLKAFSWVTTEKIFKKIAEEREKTQNELQRAILDYVLEQLKNSHMLKDVEKFSTNHNCFSILHFIRHQFNIILFTDCVNFKNVLEYQTAVNTGGYRHRHFSIVPELTPAIIIHPKIYSPNHKQPIPRLDWTGNERRHKIQNELQPVLTIDLTPSGQAVSDDNDDAFDVLERKGKLDTAIHSDIVQAAAIPFVKLEHNTQNPVVASDGRIYDSKQIERMQQHYKMSIATGQPVRSIRARGLEPALKLYAEGDIKGAIEALECPVTLEAFVDPMCCMDGGHIFDKGPKNCPICRSETLVSVKDAIDHYRNQWKEELRKGNQDSLKPD